MLQTSGQLGSRGWVPTWKLDGKPSLRELLLRSFSQFYQVMVGGFYPPICKSTRRYGGQAGGWLIHCSESQRCLCRDGVYNPDNIQDHACAVLHSCWAGHPICDPSRIIATWFSYCSINPLRPPNCIYLQADLSCLYKLNCNIFNHHERLDFSLHWPAPAICHFFWLVVTYQLVTAGSGTRLVIAQWLEHSMCSRKYVAWRYHNNLFPHLDII